MALPPRIDLFEPPGGLPPLATNVVTLGGSQLGFLDLDRVIRITRAPSGRRHRFAYEWTSGDNGTVRIWIAGARPAERYLLCIDGQCAEYTTATTMTTEALPEGCAWLPPRPWERYFWVRLKRKIL